ncbi:MAG: hypothetical protein GY715_09020 [Planctomycetes bacterium]|nr:hypothetical protein [Planctomycetota bacterium]
MTCDPIDLLLANTRAGFLSEIGYDKEDGKGPSIRLVEPLSMVEGATGLLVRCIQVEPKKGGVRHFIKRRIVSVGCTQVPTLGRGGGFVNGEIITTGWTKKTADKSGLSCPWFVTYANAVREAIDDFQIEGWELESIESLKAQLDLTLSQVRAVHAYVLSEYLMGYAGDGEFDADEEEQIEQIVRCLDELGWSPG